MCGIGGYIGTFSPETLRLFELILAHRGPDDSGIWVSEDVGLVHTRLSIIDVSSAGHQPMQDDGFTITYNGEIYNFQELREQLLSQGEVFSSSSDTEVLLKMYKNFGTEMLNMLNGIFAFAIWDADDKTLFVARDHLGVKPFYYAKTVKGFLFSSELKALQASEEVDISLDPDGIANHMIYLWSPGETTICKEIKKLLPGHAMIISVDGIKKHWKFYEIPYQKKTRSLTVEDAVSKMRRLLRQAVSRQMVADVPIGMFLSGGLDSSAVVTFAKECAPGSNLQCFSIDLQEREEESDGFVNDLPYARKVAKHLGVDLNIVTVGPEITDSLETMIYHLDEPQADPAPLNVLLISQLAAGQGMKVLLSGAGGDDIFSGYRRHFALMQEAYWKWLPQQARQGLQWASGLLPQDNVVTRRISKAFKYAGLPENERLASYFYWIEPKWLEKILSAEIKEQLGEFQPASPLLKTLENLAPGVEPLNQMLYLEGKHFLADHNLNYTDKMGMAVGVEIRVPLLDLDLVEFATSLPITYKQKGREGKWIFKKAMEGLLPNEVIYRPKTGFGAPLRYWLRNQLQDLVDDVLSHDRLKRRGVFDPAGVRALVKKNKKGQIDAAYPIFAMLCIEMWCHLFIDNNTRRDIKLGPEVTI